MNLQGNPANIPPLGFTHGGRFHADDVFSAALLRLLRPDIRLYRGFQVPAGFSGIAFDIGDGPFDHHQKDSPRRPNGAKYAAFGLLWRAYGHYLLPEEEARRFDEKFIQPLDIDDNNGTGNPIAVLIGSFNPPWDSDQSEDEAFEQAVDVATQLLGNRIKGIAAVQRGKAVVEQALKQMQQGVVQLDRYVPWKPVLVDSPAEFVVFPSPRGGYSVQCVPKEYSGKTGLKVPMPPAWRGRSAEELAEISGMEELTFCHASGFMCSVRSRAAALQVCAEARRQHEARLAQAAEAHRQNAIQKQAGSAT